MLKLTLYSFSALYLNILPGEKMYSEIYKKIDADPVVHQLVKTRRTFALKLSAVMLGIYFSFILTIAYAPSVFGAVVFEGSVTTIGIPVGVAVILSAFVLTGIYVYKANREFDKILNKLKDDVGVPHA